MNGFNSTCISTTNKTKGKIELIYYKCNKGIYILKRLGGS